MRTQEEISVAEECLKVIRERATRVEETGMTKCNFVFGVSNSLMVAWSFGALPGYFWIIYIIEVSIFLPIRLVRMCKKTPKEHWYWLDFCWCANFASVSLLAVLAFLEVDMRGQRWAFSACWGIGNGPLLCAAAVLGNKLLFHDFDNSSSVLIHFCPALVMYDMGWHRKALHVAFPSVFKYTFFNDLRCGEIYLCASVAYLFWFVPYTAWLLTIGYRKASNRGPDTVFAVNMRGGLGKVVGCRILRFSEQEHKEKVGNNSFDRSYALVYQMIHATAVFASIPVSFLCLANKWLHMCICGSMLLVITYNAASRYTYYMVSAYEESLERALVNQLGIPVRREVEFPPARDQSRERPSA